SSVMDILVALYYKYARIDLDQPEWPERDRVIVSKGHAGIALAPLLVDLGWNDRALLKTFNLTNSPMGIHLDKHKVVGLDASTGSLGHGLPIAVGTALAARVLGKEYRTWCVLGDGELNEGSNWEAAMSAAHYRLDSLIALVDRNRHMIDGPTEDVMAIEPLADKFAAFGFNTLVVDGHSFPALAGAIEAALATRGRPTCVICNTVKGAGIDFMEDNYIWHYGALDEAKHAQAGSSLDAYHRRRRAVAEREGA
ncbi:MAG: transketolase, partial [Bifidobacteriaceae bacterium]|nr:transketolase [Bifidobacteriaceae bacterium]